MVTRAQYRDANVLGVSATAKPKTLWGHYSEVVITTCTYVEKFSAVRSHVSQLYATSQGGGGGGGGGWGDSNYLRML